MSAVAVSLDHVGVGCNRVVHALDWGDASGLVAYGAHHAVVVYHPEEARVLGTLLGHTDVVTCVRWLPHAGAQLGAGCALVSGAGDGTLRVWLWTPHTPGQPWRLAATLQAHAAPLTSVATHATTGGGLLLVSTAGDGEAAVWECGGCSADEDDPLGGASWRLSQRLPLGHQLQHCAALAPLPLDLGWLLLALGGVDGAVRLYCRPPGGRFEETCRLMGHQDWVRGLAFAQVEGGRLLLASASQDKNVRVWAVAQQGDERQQQDGDSAPAPPAQALTRYAPKPAIHAGGRSYTAALEALLVGHEDWVHSVAWQPARGGGAQPACLLTASMDRTMVVWRPDAATGLWMAEESVGDAGANHLGYYSGCWGPGGAALAAHGFTGALHVWRAAPGGAGWLPAPALGGHWAGVADAAWAADGACLLSVSVDQTARLTTRLAGGRWCELARPQVHGHDFSTVAALPAGAGSGGGGGGGGAPPPPRHLYASGSEEKVVRVFEAPRAFCDTLALARGQAPAPGGGGDGGGGRGAALGALLPALGLSNKAVYEGDEPPGGGTAAGPAASGGEAYADGPDLAPHASPRAVAGPPLEEHLAQSTLWPEVRKLYGHGNELYCLAADPRGELLASACRAQSADTAAVWLWDTATWAPAGQLPAHTLTVTQLAFSPDGRFLASASRDRTVAVWERQQGQRGEPGAAAAAQPPFRLLGRIKAHARIVWGLHWSPDGALLATASRDGKVKVWSLEGDGAAPALPVAPLAALECGDSVHAVAFAPACQPCACYHLAAGLEGGALQLLRLELPPGQPARGELVWQASRYERHAAAVRRLCWRRDEEPDGGGGDAATRFHLASCSDDHSVRVFSVLLPP